MLARVLLSMVLVVGLVGLTGCGAARLDETKNWTLDGDNPAKGIDLPAQSAAQTLKVDYESTEADVSIGVYKAEDAKDVGLVQKSKALAHETGKTSGSFTVEVPANTAVCVVASSGLKKSDVKLHVTNKK